MPLAESSVLYAQDFKATPSLPRKEACCTSHMVPDNRCPSRLLTCNEAPRNLSRHSHPHLQYEVSERDPSLT